MAENSATYRPIIALALGSLALLAVVSISAGDGFTKEAVAPTFVEPTSQAPEDTFVESDELPKDLKEAAEKAGDDAKGPTETPSPYVKTEDKTVIHTSHTGAECIPAGKVVKEFTHMNNWYKKDDRKARSSDCAWQCAHKFKDCKCSRFSKREEGSCKLYSEDASAPTHKKDGKMTEYKANCLTLKAYAMNVVDKVTDMSFGTLNVLKPIILAVAPKGDCITQLSAEFAKLNSDKSIAMDDSIALGMTRRIEYEMKEGRGILVWKNLEFHNAGCQLDPVECLKISKTEKAGSNFIYIDAERVGWSGSPKIFHRLAVRSNAVIDAAHTIKAEGHLVKNSVAMGHKGPVEPFLTKKQREELKAWDGNF